MTTRAADDAFTLRPIGVMRTCFAEKFGVPRQARMVREAWGVIELGGDARYRDALAGLERFSHIWVLYVFHQHVGEPWAPMITPPRLDAPARVGTFASRSPHRPNPLGFSALKLDRIAWEAPGGVALHVSGVDVLDGTPVLDIKPYLPFADVIPEATSGWAESAIPRYRVEWSEPARALADGPLGAARHPRFAAFVTELLEWDPRPTPQRRTMPVDDPRSEGREFAFRVLGVDVRWEIRGGGFRVVDLIEL